jgi:hypothetical protein
VTADVVPREDLTRHLCDLISRSGAGGVPEDLAIVPADLYLIAEAPAQFMGKRRVGHHLAQVTPRKADAPVVPVLAWPRVVFAWPRVVFAWPRAGRQDLSKQPQFDLIEEDVNLLLVLTRPQAGGREALVPNLIPCQRWLPYSEERVANLCEEAINLLLVIARPQAGGRESTRLDPPGEHGAASFGVGCRPWRQLLSRAGARGRGYLGARVGCHGQLMDGRGPAPDAELSISSLRRALPASHLQQPSRSRGPCQLTRHELSGLTSMALRMLATTPS